MVVLAHKAPISVQMSALCLYVGHYRILLTQSEELAGVSGLHCAVADIPLKKTFKEEGVGFILHILEKPIVYVTLICKF